MFWAHAAYTARVVLAFGAVLAAAQGTVLADEADPAAKNTLTIQITGLKDHEKGRMACGLFWENKGFPRKHRRALRRAWVEVDGQKTVDCVFKRTGLGVYAASVFLDRNRNGKLDSSVLGGPKEPWGVSNNATPKRFGPPAYKDASFRYEGGPVTIEVKLRYD